MIEQSGWVWWLVVVSIIHSFYYINFIISIAAFTFKTMLLAKLNSII
jgi:hypothetical protein